MDRARLAGDVPPWARIQVSPHLGSSVLYRNRRLSDRSKEDHYPLQHLVSFRHDPSFGPLVISTVASPIWFRSHYRSGMSENKQLVPTGVSVALTLIVAWFVLRFVFKLVALLTNLLVIAGLIAAVVWLLTRQQKKA